MSQKIFMGSLLNSLDFVSFGLFLWKSSILVQFFCYSKSLFIEKWRHEMIDQISQAIDKTKESNCLQGMMWNCQGNKIYLITILTDRICMPHEGLLSSWLLIKSLHGCSSGSPFTLVNQCSWSRLHYQRSKKILFTV